jgi:hypothetical protein
MSNEVYNADTLRGIAHNAFYGELVAQEEKRIYPKICEVITQSDLTTVYTSFGATPEPRQLSGSQAASGERQAYGLKDYTITGTVVEWEQTVKIPRATIETNPDEIPRKMREMAAKASMFMDRRLVGTVLPAATAGYDGVGIYSAAHPESGTNQDNDLTAAAATGTAPTGAELEAALDVEIGTLKKFTDDRLTPVNEGVSKYFIVVPAAFEFLYKTVLMPANVSQTPPGLDVSGGTGRFRGMFTVLASAFVATDDRHYLITEDNGQRPVALLKNKDFEFTTNIGTDSDIWRLGQMAVFSSYARWEFIPWKWSSTLIEVWT